LSPGNARTISLKNHAGLLKIVLLTKEKHAQPGNLRPEISAGLSTEPTVRAQHTKTGKRR
jgi:hypothetical protein